MADTKKVLFVCTHNSARSQMCEAILNKIKGDRYEAFSAGTHPAGVNPLTMEVLEEVGIDTVGMRSKSVEEFLDQNIDLVITVCDSAEEACPFFPGGKERRHRSFPDPTPYAAIQGIPPIEGFRRIRDMIWEWIEEEL